MNIKHIKSLIKEKESSTVEFKSSTAQLRPAFETICAFLNNQGGTVLIGVNDKGELIGQDVADHTRQLIANEICRLEPPAQLEIKYIPIAKTKQIIMMQVKPGLHAPYSYDGRPFQREQSVTKKMSQQRYDQLITKRNSLNHSWEKSEAEYDLDWLDQNQILGVIRQGVQSGRLPEIALRQEISQTLESLNLLINKRLNNAAVVLFGTRFMPDYPQCHIKMARFKGLDRHEFIDSDLIYGNIFDLLEKAMVFVRRHLPVAAKIEPGKLERIETPLIPLDAVREALINALCHRDYNINSGSVGIAIYDDRMEIFNDGGLLHGLTLEKIKAGFSKPRNPLLADVFYKCKLIEKWGRGIQEIIKSCITANELMPDFLVDEIEFKVLFKFVANIGNQFSLKKLEEKFENKLSNRQKEIVTILSEVEELKMKDILAQLTAPPAERTLKDDLNLLKKLGIINSRGRARTSTWFLIKNQA